MELNLKLSSYLHELLFGKGEPPLSNLLLVDALSKLLPIVISDGLDSRLVVHVCHALPTSFPSHDVRIALIALIELEVRLHMKTRCMH